MTLHPLHLAAIVSAGIPGIYPVGAQELPDAVRGYDAAVIQDSAERRWRVLAPQDAETSIRLEAEHLILQSFTPALRARLPFAVPTVAGTVPYEGRSIFIYTYVPGKTYSINNLAALNAQVARAAGAHRDLAQEIGTDIATLHVTPEDIIYEADLPSYSAEELRVRKASELERAAASGHIPADLLHYWRMLLSPEHPMWQFRPRVVHGSLDSEKLVLNRGKVVEVTGWSELHVGDPAIDFAWLYSCEDTDFADRIIEIYRQQMPQLPDAYLAARAEFYADFATARWLLNGMNSGNDEMVQTALSIMLDIQDDLRATGRIS